jgi:elongation factor G
VASVFSVKSDPHVGKVCLARIWSGTLGDHDAVHRGDGQKAEKVGGLYHPVGRGREAVTSAGPGEIVAFSKVDHLSAGDAFTTGEGGLRVVPAPEMPTPMVSLALFPKSRNDETKIGEALHKLVAEDPTLRMVNDPVTHELVVSGMSDLHLQVLISRLERRYGVSVDSRLPRIAFRETITRPAEGQHRHKKQSGGRGQFAECHVRVRPRERGEGNLFTDRIVGGSIPRNLIPAVEKGFLEAAREGVMAHSTVVDVELEVHDGKFHAVDSDEASFKMAGARAFREAFEKAGPVLLEPVMTVEIHVPTEDAGAIFSDLTSNRRGHVTEQEAEAGGAVTMIRAEVPLSTMQTYHRDLKSLTSGEGTYSMGFSSYAPMPAAEQQRVLRELAADREAG